MAHAVFISYATADLLVAESVCAALEAAAIACWIAPRDMPGGARYGGVLEEAIEESQALVLVLSGASIRSPFVEREIERAVSRNVPIVPLRLDQAPLSPALTFFLSNRHWLTTASPPVERDYTQLVEAVQRLVSSPKAVRGESFSTASVQAPASVYHGALVPKMCDRRPQEARFGACFTRYFRDQPSVPQVYLVRGSERECHRSLFERLVLGQIVPVAEKKWGAQRCLVAAKSLDWPYVGDLTELELQLLRGLFEEFETGYLGAEYSAEAFLQLPSVAASNVVAIEHTLHAHRWRPGLRQLMEQYLVFWASLPHGPRTPQVVVFFSVLYPSAGETRWPIPLLRRPFNRRRVDEELDAALRTAYAGRPAEVLPELTPPEQGDVKDWFLRFNLYDAKTREEKCEELFRAARGRLSMQEIEHRLTRIHEEYVRERGAR